jgi:predicted transcriptional regulator
VARKKTTMYIDPELLKATKILAARTGRHDYEVVADALRSYLGLEVVETVWQRSRLTEDEAMALAGSEVHADRTARRAR